MQLTHSKESHSRIKSILNHVGATCAAKPRTQEQEEIAMSVVGSWQRPATEGAAPLKTPPVYKRAPPVFQHNSLPRKSNFHRNTPARRSVGAEPLVEYFVPRSVSEFDLSITNDIPLLNPRMAQQQKNKLPAKSREKMVTFEDEMAGRKNPLEDVFMWPNRAPA